MVLQSASLQLFMSHGLANWAVLSSSQTSNKHSSFCKLPQNPLHSNPSTLSFHIHNVRMKANRIGATLNEDSVTSSLTNEQQSKSNMEVENSVKVLKEAAKTRKVPKEEILSALSVMEKSKLDPSKFLETLGGTESPGKTWMLIFTAEKQYNGGRYFPLTAIQRFDAAGKRIENGVYLGPIGALTFEGRFTWKNKILAFIFECVRIKVGPLKPFELSLGEKDDREPSTKDPFFIWFYIDDEIAVARGKSGGTAFWCRCQRVTS